jgi:hypothetical protein
VEEDPPTPALRALLSGRGTIRSPPAAGAVRVATAIRAWAIRLLGAPVLEIQCTKCGTPIVVLVDRSGTVVQCNACLIGVNIEAQIQHHRRNCCHCGEPGPADKWRA